MKDTNSNILGRPRGMTEIAVTWMVDRVRKCEDIRRRIDSGQYLVNPDIVAKSMVEAQERIKRFDREIEGPEN